MAGPVVHPPNAPEFSPEIGDPITPEELPPGPAPVERQARAMRGGLPAAGCAGGAPPARGAPWACPRRTGAGGAGAGAPDGGPRATFDPAKPVVARFTHLGGRRTQVSGVLPLSHSVVIKDTEFRFAMRPDDRRGFGRVTSDRCTFP